MAISASVSGGLAFSAFALVFAALRARWTRLFRVGTSTPNRAALASLIRAYASSSSVASVGDYVSLGGRPIGFGRGSGPIWLGR